VELDISTLVGWFVIACPSLSVTNRPKKAWLGHVTNFRNSTPTKDLRNG